MVNCSFCEKPINRDRYNLSLEIERQDHVPTGGWAKTYDSYRENICSKCANIILAFYGHFVDMFRENKGQINPGEKKDADTS